MDLIFTRKELLDVPLEEEVLGAPYEQLWHEQLASLSKRALVTAGVNERVPFVLASDGTVDVDLAELFRTFAGQTAGRTTMFSYAQHAIRLVRYLTELSSSIANVRPAQLATYRRLRNASGIEPLSWNSEAAALKSFFDAAVLLELRPDNPCNFPTLIWYNKGAHVEAKEPDFITLAQFQCFRDEGLAFGRYGLRNVAFANLLLTSGMRLDEGNEYLAEWLPDVNVLESAPGQSLKHTITAEAAKGHRSRSVRVSKAAYDSMRMYGSLLREDQIATAISKCKYDKAPEQFWLNQEGLHMGEIGWGDVFRRATKRTGIKATPKTLRHTCAVYLLSRLLRNSLMSVSEARAEAQKMRGSSPSDIYNSIFGDPLRKVQKYLGHKNYDTTFIYLDILGSHQGIDDEALAVFDDVIGTEEGYSDVAF